MERQAPCVPASRGATEQWVGVRGIGDLHIQGEPDPQHSHG